MLCVLQARATLTQLAAAVLVVAAGPALVTPCALAGGLGGAAGLAGGTALEAGGGAGVRDGGQAGRSGLPSWRW